MKKGVCILCALAVGATAWAQNNRFDSGNSDVISRDPSSSAPRAEPGTRTQEDVTFSSDNGEMYSLRELAAELRNLRSAVEETLPALKAFNKSQGGTAETESTSVSGAISEVLGALGGRGTNSGSSSNVLTVLEGLLSTNAPGVLKPDERTAKQLAVIERHLVEVNAALQALNVAASPGPWQESGERDRTGPLTPTGRDEPRRDDGSDY